uniref:Uncharacterized protein n=1 Tax=Opuntia streptacantha TaxID=393608 RepID=A0A7C8YLW9_OPUST
MQLSACRNRNRVLKCYSGDHRCMVLQSNKCDVLQSHKVKLKKMSFSCSGTAGSPSSLLTSILPLCSMRQTHFAKLRPPQSLLCPWTWNQNQLRPTSSSPL